MIACWAILGPAGARCFCTTATEPPLVCAVTDGSGNTSHSSLFAVRYSPRKKPVALPRRARAGRAGTGDERRSRPKGGLARGSARQQHVVDDVDDAVRLIDVLYRHPRGMALAVADGEHLPLELEGQLF